MLKWKRFWNQLNIVQKGIVEQLITYSSIFILSLLILGITTYNKDDNYDFDQQTSQVEQITESKKYHHDKAIQQDALEGNSSNPIMQTLLQNRKYNEQPLKNIKRFFTVFYTYDSNGVYQARGKKIQAITTPQIAKSKYWFNSHYNGYHSVLSDMSSTEMSHIGNNDNLLVECHTTSWMPVNTQNDEESNKHSIGQWYSVTYNVQNGKITNIQKLYTNKNSNNDFNTTSTTQSGSGVYY